LEELPVSAMPECIQSCCQYNILFLWMSNNMWRAIGQVVYARCMRRYSMGILSMVCEDLPSDVAFRGAFVKVLAVIPGPCIPANVACILRPILDRMVLTTHRKVNGLPMLGGGGGKKTKPFVVRAAADIHAQDPVSVQQAGASSAAVPAPLVQAGVALMHAAYFTSFVADTPARVKAANWMGVGAYLACGWCLFEGTPVPNPRGKGTTNYYPGYAKASPQTLR
jgi:hypothetical protein